MFKKYFERRKKEQYRRGYDYAAGALLRNEETGRSLSAKISIIDFTEFDRGVIDAIIRLGNLGVLECYLD